MSSIHSDNSNNELLNIMSDYTDDFFHTESFSNNEITKPDTASSIEDGECISPVNTVEQEQLLREKLIKSFKSRKRSPTHSPQHVTVRKSLKVDNNLDYSFSNIRSRFDSINSESDEENQSLNLDSEKKLNNLNKTETHKVIESSSELSNQMGLFEEHAGDTNGDAILTDTCEQNNRQLECNKESLYYPAKHGCRLLDSYKILNRIEEGTYGEVFRARDLHDGRIYALKRLKLENDKYGFPITSIREVNTLMIAQHVNVVNIREVVVGKKFDTVYLAMEFVEHDLKSFLKVIQRPLEISEVKCLMLQLLAAVAHLHDNWIIHRDLKTSNLLLSHSGVLKLADFGLAREYGSPLKCYTSLVVTLWYRAPELLLGETLYSTNIDMWSVGCIFGELLLNRALFSGKCEMEQINIIFREMGLPNEDVWPGISQLPIWKKMKFKVKAGPRNEKRLMSRLSSGGNYLFNKLLSLCPTKRFTADEAMKHFYFDETPLPMRPDQFPKYPAKSESCPAMITKKLQQKVKKVF